LHAQEPWGAEHNEGSAWTKYESISVLSARLTQNQHKLVKKFLTYFITPIDAPSVTRVPRCSHCSGVSLVSAPQEVRAALTAAALVLHSSVCNHCCAPLK